jgi:NADH-quinone oxidoreductase subunit D
LSNATATAPNYELIQRDGLDTGLLEISMGPHHPSTHGVFRMDVKLDGETVVDLQPVFGYLHRNHEKLAENMSYLSSMPFTDRLDYFNSMTNNWAYALAAEQLIEIEIPERAEYLRVIMSELTRLVNHVSLVGFFVNDLGALGTPLLYAFREREKILDLFEQASGARMMCNYFRFGGLRNDVPEGWLDRAREVVDRFPKFLDEYEKLLCENEIILSRTQGVGNLSKELAISAGITGPMLRASGESYDIRKVDRYGIYDRFQFRVPYSEGDVGDCYDRFMVRMLEMRESIGILKQALDGIEDGPVLGNAPKVFKPKPAEAYGRIEAPKGELGFYLIADGTPKPYRFRVRPPSFINLTVLRDMCLGQKVADAVIILGSIDIVLGEVDR